MTCQIITFYSYKGGVGRSMALANLGWVLASSGKRVLVVDWDLEGPSLNRYFAPFLEDWQLSSTNGIIDAAIDFVGGTVSAVDVLDYAASLSWEFANQGGADFVPAGRQSPAYPVRVTEFQWGRFLSALNGQAFLDGLSGSMRESYDYVLIDTHAGLSEASSMCTNRLSDAVVLCFTLSGHMIEGSQAAAERIVAQATNRPIRIFPVPTRVESAEYDLLNQIRSRARAGLDPYLQHLAPDARAQYWADVEVPYYPAYAFGETVAAFHDDPGRVNSVLGASERLARHLTGESTLQVSYPLPEQREATLQAYRSRVSR